MEVDVYRLAPTDLSPGMAWYPLYRRLDLPQGRSGRVCKTLPYRDSMKGFNIPD